MRREQDPTAQAGEIRHFSLGSNLNARDRKAVRRTVSGLTKILHSDRQVEKQDMVRILKFAIEGRRRVKEQLKKMGSFEYYQTSFKPPRQRDRGKSTMWACRSRAGSI